MQVIKVRSARTESILFHLDLQVTWPYAYSIYYSQLLHQQREPSNAKKPKTIGVGKASVWHQA